MNKLSKKDTIQHYLLNLLTSLDAEISNLKINNQKRAKLNNLINRANILIAHENIFLNNKSNLFIQEVSLKEVIEIICKILNSEIKKHSITVNIPDDDYIVKVDKFYFTEALKSILKRLIEDSTKIKFKFDHKKNILKIFHNKKIKFEKPEKNLLKNINKKNIDFHLACKIIEVHGITLKFKQNLIEIDL